ncbi:MAG TPA: Crp/Fnr family transcriptional regulator [Burkholderiales bacterium]|nr:Crp/Fnr family transcriptional regulator [Burkholderiales bacterium]
MGNLVLNALPAAERDWLSARAQDILVKRHQLLHVTGEKLAWHYFPLDCLLAVYGVAPNGETAEYTILAAEGFTGVSATLGDARSIGNAIVIVEGVCTRVSVSVLREACQAGGLLPQLLLRYASMRAFHLSQASLCRSHHPVNKRLARWLLQCFDRLPEPVLQLTHERLATVLGVRREAVSLALHELHKTSAIASRRGQIALKDRDRLEARACECYAAFSAELRKLLVDVEELAPSKGSQAKYTDGAFSSKRR